MRVKALFQFARNRLRRVIFRGCLNHAAIACHGHSGFVPINRGRPGGPDQHLLTWPPIARINHQIPDHPSRLINQEVLDMPNLPIPGVNIISGDFLCAAQMRIAGPSSRQVRG